MGCWISNSFVFCYILNFDTWIGFHLISIIWQLRSALLSFSFLPSGSGQPLKRFLMDLTLWHPDSLLLFSFNIRKSASEVSCHYQECWIFSSTVRRSEFTVIIEQNDMRLGECHPERQSKSHCKCFQVKFPLTNVIKSEHSRLPTSPCVCSNVLWSSSTISSALSATSALRELSWGTKVRGCIML